VLTEPDRPRVVRDLPWAGWLAVGTVCFGAFMGQLDASIVTLAFPALQRDLGAPLAAVEWVSLSYLLTLVGLMVPAGRVADAVGRKNVYLAGFVLFTAASAACGLAPGLGWLVAFRVVQAIGASMIQSNSVGIVVTSLPREQMRAGLGVQAAAQALGLALGPVLGGLLVETVGWRWVFWVNVPVGVLAVGAGWFLLPRTRHLNPLTGLDGRGLVLLVGSTTTLLIGLSGLSGLAMPGWVAAALVVVAGLVVVVLVRWERRAPHPLVEPEVLGTSTVRVGLLGALAAYLLLFGPLALLPQVMGGHGATGLVLSALPAGFAVAALAGERLLPRRWGARARGVTGAVTATVGVAALVVAPTHAAWVAPWLAVLGLGLGVFIPANNSAIMGAMPARVAGVGGGMVTMVRGLGTAVGVAVVALALHVAGVTAEGARVALVVLTVVALGVVVAARSAPAQAPTPEAETR
jgi:EmrB/QacA subfamily drug resistance transporter